MTTSICERLKGGIDIPNEIYSNCIHSTQIGQMKRPNVQRYKYEILKPTNEKTLSESFTKAPRKGKACHDADLAR